MTMVCSKCGAEYRDEVAECTDCLTPLTQLSGDQTRRDKFRYWTTVLATGEQTLLEAAMILLQQHGIQYRTRLADEAMRRRPTADEPRSTSAFNPVLLQVRERDGEGACTMLRSDSRFAAAFVGTGNRNRTVHLEFVIHCLVLVVGLILLVIRPAWGFPVVFLAVVVILSSIPRWHRYWRKLLR